MVTLSAKDKWLVDAGVRLLPDARAKILWSDWSVDQDRLIADGKLTAPLSPEIAEIAIAALKALAADLRRTLDRVGLADEEEDELVNDLEMVELAQSGIVQDDLGSQGSNP